MWIVRLALRRPYTFVVGALLVVIFGVLSLVRTPTDIFPEIDIPVVSVIWQYNGLPPEEMERRIATVSERAMTTTVNDIEHIESQSVPGITVIKVFFHPGAKIESAVAQLSAISTTVTRTMPPGAQPPFILRFNASNVPVLQASLSSETLSEQELYDLGTNGIRTRLATVQGASVPQPYGGRARLINVDLDPQALHARGVSPSDVSNAINAQNLVLPSGTAKIGDREYFVRMNGSPEAVAALNDLPIRTVNGVVVRIRDVAYVRDGYGVQTNIVRRDGKRGALITVLKAGGASTIDVVDRVKAALPPILATLPPTLKVELLADQSRFVKGALEGVLHEAVIAACLTAAMILLFLGSWRSTLIVALSIPLSILCSVIVLSALGQTMNVMTLGGLALAVGVLVDDATVGIENIHRHLHDGKDVEDAILDGAQQIAVPTLVSTLAICIVFVPVFFLGGAAGSLFAPLAMAVVFAMLASYVISRTLVPTLVKYALEYEARRRGGPGPIERVHLRFDAAFERMRARYRDALTRALARRARVAGWFAAGALASCLLIPFLGQNFFPAVDAGQLRLHLRMPPGTRVEETERVVADVERTIRRVIPANELATILDNVGISGAGGSNLAYSDNPTIGAGDADILISLSEERTRGVEDYRRELRRVLRAEYPQVTLFFQAADIVGQILNFGLPAPIDVQVVGNDRAGNLKVARTIEQRLKTIPGAVDVRLHQVVNAPELFFTVDRDRATALAMTERDVAGNVLVSLASSGQTAPNFWLNPQNGVQYQVSVQTPQYRVASVADIGATPILPASGAGAPQLLDNLAQVTRRAGLAVVNHYNVQPVYDVFAGVQDRDLGGVARDVDRVLDEIRPTLPRGSTLVMRGQVASMRQAFTGLGYGLALAVLLVYLLMVVNFQSWLDPLIIATALPGALAGIAWALYVTQTPLSVPALMGAIMSIGVATANGILVVSFANERHAAGLSARDAALDAGYTRLRPVLMTATAMVLGMLPMALGLGEAGEQNAPLGRAVIGGLAFATLATLFVVPVAYAALKGRRAAAPATRDTHPRELAA
ncbi:efflux RND transporter permease subunit [Roseisolibacter sp. H3M3-2]|uniref:efflux RND transporter permease subunit n=1 Tax=Roseisolibacter sp. H3M3-2 TaxID=3031323 RepID=UPI0023DA13C3|nr:efflux RND transporter permease subunit [Roseisolibacter sp. H3M3-2]MDF1504157.1 efflux RND transporter permease subunit [Roseisolibacter sp. H3M3-2]